MSGASFEPAFAAVAVAVVFVRIDLLELAIARSFDSLL